MDFMLGIIFGSVLGFAICSLSNSAGNQQAIVNVKEFYKCKNYYSHWCGNLCCKGCLAADTCTETYKCVNNPNECGQAVKIK